MDGRDNRPAMTKSGGACLLRYGGARPRRNREEVRTKLRRLFNGIETIFRHALPRWAERHFPPWRRHGEGIVTSPPLARPPRAGVQPSKSWPGRAIAPASFSSANCAHPQAAALCEATTFSASLPVSSARWSNAISNVPTPCVSERRSMMRLCNSARGICASTLSQPFHPGRAS